MPIRQYIIHFGISLSLVFSLFYLSLPAHAGPKDSDSDAGHQNQEPEWEFESAPEEDLDNWDEKAEGEKTEEELRAELELEIEIKRSLLDDLLKQKPSTISEKDAQFMRETVGLDPVEQQIINNQILGGWKHRMRHQIRGFAPEALVFYTAIGAAMARKSWTDQLISGRRDPRWLANLGHELKSPVGVFSFFCFLIASGQTNYWASQSLRPWARALQRQKIRYVGRKSGFRNPYQLSQKGFQYSAGWFGHLGMAAGIMASNVVSELYKLTQNPAIGYCANYLLPAGLSNPEESLSSQNGDIICDSAYEEVMATVQSWGPDLVSVIVASIINHAFTRRLAVVADKGKTASVALLQKVRVKASVPIQRFISQLLLLMPTPGGIATRVGFWTVRFYNLYTFMEIAELTDHYMFHGWKEDIKAQSLSNSVSQFIQKFDPYSSDQGLQCESDSVNNIENRPPINNIEENRLIKLIREGFVPVEPTNNIEGNIEDNIEGNIEDNIEGNVEDNASAHPSVFKATEDDTSTHRSQCVYHDSIISAHSVSNNFSRWRQFQLLTAQTAKQNWFLYVSSTIASFDKAYQFYRQLFKSKHYPTLLNQPYYFGAFGAVNSHLFYDEETKKKVPVPVEIAQIFEAMTSKITQYLNQTTSPSDTKDTYSVPLNVVSSMSDSFHFSKPEIALHHSWSNPSPITLSNDFDALLVLEKVFSVVNSEISLSSFYDDWDKEVELAKDIVIKQQAQRLKHDCDQALSAYQESLLLKKSAEKDPEIISQFLFQKNMSQEQYFKLMEEQVGILLLCTRMVSKDTTSQPELILKQVEEKKEVLTWEQALQVEKDNFQKKPKELQQAGEDILKQKVLASGVDLLTRIVKAKTLAHKYYPRKVLSPVERQKIDQLKAQNYPKELTMAIEKLGPDYIFVQLFQELYRSSTFGTYNYNIKPSLPGMDTTKQQNNMYKQEEEQLGITSHPRVVGTFVTRNITDFLVVSSLCGPQLHSNTVHRHTLSNVQQIVSGETSVEKVWPDQKMDDIIAQLPVFDRLLTGSSFHFYPPRVAGLDLAKKDVANICDSYKLNHPNSALIKSPTSNSFSLGGKKYEHLLHLVVDNSSSKIFRNVHDFDKWWEQNVQPYYDLFVLLADREYNQLMQAYFLHPLFQSQDINMEIEDRSVLGVDQLFAGSTEGFSDSPHKTWFTNKNTKTDFGRFAARRLSPIEEVSTYQWTLSKGIFQNIYQEMNYWGDIIISLVQDDSDNRGEIEDHISTFTELFHLPTEYWDEKEGGVLEFFQQLLSLKPNQITDGAKEQYLKWVKEFLTKKGEITHFPYAENICKFNGDKKKLNKMQQAYIHLYIAACLLNVDTAILSSRRKAPEIAMNFIPNLNAGGFTSAIDRKVGFFYDGEEQSVQKQMLNFAVIRLTDLMLEFSSYLDMTMDLSQTTDIKKVVPVKDVLKDQQ